VIRLAILGICACLAMNLLTQFGLGLALLAEGNGKADGDGAGDTVPDGDRDPAGEGILSLPAFLGLSASLFLLWALFNWVLAPLGPGFYWYLLLYPLSAALIKGLERLLLWASAPERSRAGFFSGIAGSLSRIFLPSGRTEFLPLGLLLSLHLAPGPLEALVLALGFSLGVRLSLGILREIRRRSRFEAVPPLLRGSPLALISLGLLSLIFTSVSIIFFNLSRF
jgi:electron transport complex protein RnfA